MIDWSRIEELRDEFGEAEFSEIVDIFLLEVLEGMDMLKGTVKKSEVEKNLHFLKGCALNLGFSRFAKICETYEEKSSQVGEQEVSILQKAFEASKAELFAANT